MDRYKPSDLQELKVVYQSKSAKICAGYLELEFDINYIKQLVKFFTDKYSFKEYFSANSREVQSEDALPMFSLFTSIIILYGKCFTSAERRGVKLEGTMFHNADKKIKRTHQVIIDARDNLIAHAGNTILEKYELVIIWDNGLVVDYSKENFKTRSGEIIESQNMNPLLDFILSNLSIKIEKLKLKLRDEIITLELKLPMLIEKSKNNQPVTDSDLK